MSGPYCSPTRAGLLTGRYQQRFGHEFNPGNGPELGLPLSETTIADRLRSAGYATGLVGKWHLGAAPEFHPQRRGFDEFFGFLGGAHSYFPGQGAPIYRGTSEVKEPGYLTDAFGREAVAFIDRHKAGPFFLYLAFNAVHTPMDATDARLKRFEAIADTRRRTYAAMLTAMDEAVGQVLDKLRAEGLDEDTLVVFFSDNGGPTMPGTTINASRNDPLRGSKRTTLEGGIRVPFAWRWTGTLPAGTVYERPIIQLDVLPTALAAAGVEAEPGWRLDGVNLLPYLSGREARRSARDALLADGGPDGDPPRRVEAGQLRPRRRRRGRGASQGRLGRHAPEALQPRPRHRRGGRPGRQAAGEAPRARSDLARVGCPARQTPLGGRQGGRRQGGRLTIRHGRWRTMDGRWRMMDDG